MYLYLRNKESNVPFRLSPQWLRGKTCTWAHDIHHDLRHKPLFMYPSATRILFEINEDLEYYLF